MDYSQLTAKQRYCESCKKIYHFSERHTCSAIIEAAEEVKETKKTRKPRATKTTKKAK